MGIIDTATKQLLPWRSQLWDDEPRPRRWRHPHLRRRHRPRRLVLRREQRIGWRRAADQRHRGRLPAHRSLADQDSTSSRCGSRGTSTASTRWPSPRSRSTSVGTSGSSSRRRPTTRGRASTTSATAPVRAWPATASATRWSAATTSRRSRPPTGKALEWYPMSGSNSFEGDKAMEATPRGLFVGGDGMFKGGVRTGRVAFYDFNSVPFPAPAARHDDHRPRSRAGSSPTTRRSRSPARRGSPPAPSAGCRCRSRTGTAASTSRTTAPRSPHFGGTANTLNATLAPGTGTTRTWSIVPATASPPTATCWSTAQAFTAATGGTGDSTKATKKFESFSTEDQTPTTSHQRSERQHPDLDHVHHDRHRQRRQRASTRCRTGSATSRTATCRTTGPSTTSSTRSAATPDVIGATNATWSYEVTLPHEGEWRGSATATDTIGQADLRSATRDWLIDSTAVAPTVTIQQPVEMTPPFTVPAITVEPGGQMTFSGTAVGRRGPQGRRGLPCATARPGRTSATTAPGALRSAPATAGSRRSNISGSTYNWTYTTPFNLSPGSLLASRCGRPTTTDLTTSSTNQGRLTINATVRRRPAAERDDDLHRPDRRVADGQPRGNRHRRHRRRERARLACRSGTPAATCRPTARWRPRSPTATPPSTRPTRRARPGRCRRSPSRPEATGASRRIAFDTPTGSRTRVPATATYQVYPNDGPPALSRHPRAAAERRVVRRRQDRRHRTRGGRTGRQRQHRRGARSAIVNSAGQYMSSGGTFTSTTAELPHGVPQQPRQRWVELLVHDAGHPGRDLQRPRAGPRPPRPAERQRPRDRW